MSRHPNIEVFDLSMKRVAVLNTASDIRETEKLNDVSELSFRIPKNDTKVEHIKPRHFVRFDNGETYRILAITDAKGSIGIMQVDCEHVLATLADDIMFRDHVVGNAGQDTSTVINYILSHQTERRWILSACDFTYEYEYGWSSENLLNALFSVVKPFSDLYKFETNTHAFPFELSLKRIDQNSPPQFCIFERLNFLEEQKKHETLDVFTRLYGLGAGEGVNQVTIADVNDGKPYIDAPQTAIEKHGLISGVFTAREYDSPETLKAVMDAMILEVCEPRIEYSVKAVDLHEINKRDILEARTGEIIRLSDGHRTYITEISRDRDIPGNMSLKIANKPKDVASQIASLADRQRIESTYSQGATQLWSNTTADNASPADGHEHSIWIPSDARIINKVMLKIKLSKFRAYSKATSAGGGSTNTSSSDGGGNVTSGAGGGTTLTSNQSSVTTSGVWQGVTNGRTGSSGTTTATTGGASSGESHTHRFTAATNHSHTYTFSMQHSHQINHFHSITVDNHTHMIPIGSHSHTVNVPEHSHTIEYGIFTATESPTSAMVYVGNEYAFSIGTSYEGDITQYLIGTDGKIPRGRWIEIRVVPDTLARVTVSSAPQAFIQSKTGGNY